MAHSTRSVARERPGALAPPHDEKWYRSFASQYTTTLIAAALPVAKQRAATVARVNPAADDYYAKELLADAVEDTLTGVLRWDPEVRPLLHHLCLAIWTRSNHDYQRAVKFRSVPLHLDGDDAPELLAEVETALHDRSATGHAESMLANRERMSQLRELAVADPEASAILEAWEAHASDRSEVMAHTGMSAKAYHAARERLTRLAKKLPRPERHDRKGT